MYNILYTYISKAILATEQEMNGKNSMCIKYAATFQATITTGTKL